MVDAWCCVLLSCGKIPQYENITRANHGLNFFVFVFLRLILHIQLRLSSLGNMSISICGPCLCLYAPEDYCFELAQINLGLTQVSLVSKSAQ